MSCAAPFRTGRELILLTARRTVRFSLAEALVTARSVPASRISESRPPGAPFGVVIGAAVQVVTGSVVAHGGAWVGVTAAIWTLRRLTTASRIARRTGRTGHSADGVEPHLVPEASPWRKWHCGKYIREGQ